jgi:hypothetical protein
MIFGHDAIACASRFAMEALARFRGGAALSVSGWA